LQSVVLRREIELKVAVFLCIGWKVIGADRNVAPLKALADVPDRLLARTPRRKMVELSAQLAQPLSSNPFEAALFRRVAVSAGHIEPTDLARCQRHAA